MYKTKKIDKNASDPTWVRWNIHGMVQDLYTCLQRQVFSSCSLNLL